MIKKSGWFLILVLMTASCLDEPECFSLNNNIVGITFRKMSDRQSDTVYLVSITSPSTDSIFAESVALNGIDLPLNFFEDTTDFAFNAYDGLYDLQITYESRAQFVSEDCGERYVLSGLRATSAQFDSVRILNESPKRNLERGSTLELYRCPNTSAIKFKLVSAVELTQVITNPQAIPLVVSKGSFLHVTVPLDPAQDQSTITFAFQDGTSRTITIAYSKTQRTLFQICGQQTLIHDIEQISSTFSNTVIVNDSIQDTGSPNIEINY